MFYRQSTQCPSTRLDEEIADTRAKAIFSREGTMVDDDAPLAELKTATFDDARVLTSGASWVGGLKVRKGDRTKDSSCSLPEPGPKICFIQATVGA